MFDDENFSLTLDSPQPSEETLEGIRTLITNTKQKHKRLVQEQLELSARRDDLQDTTKQFRQRSERLSQSLQDDRRENQETIHKEKEKLNVKKQEEQELMEELRRMEEELKEETTRNSQLKQQIGEFSAVPEKRVVFKGHTGSAAERFHMKPRIVWPMDGGTALCTFEEAAVARAVLNRRQHEVNLGGEVNIKVEAQPLHLLMPHVVEFETEVSPHSVLISELPEMDTEVLLNKLEIHFSKSRHGGGEVDECELLPDSGNVVITFVLKDVARRLAETEYHTVSLQQGKSHRVRVTPFLSGSITDLKTKMSVCSRTLLLTGIPDVMERETLQDLLEIHFQKVSNGGGEIEAFLYNPLGQETSALFEGVTDDEDKE